MNLCTSTRRHFRRRSGLMAAAVFVVLAACGSGSTDAPASPAQLPNPASAHCEEQGGRVVIVDEAGGQVGYCEFADGSRCEEWAYYRGECAPGEVPRPARTEGPQ